MSIITAALSAAEARGHIAGLEAARKLAKEIWREEDSDELSVLRVVDAIDARIAALTSKEGTQ